MKLTIDKVCIFLENLTTDSKWFQKLKLALEEVTVEDVDETTQDVFDRQSQNNI